MSATNQIGSGAAAPARKVRIWDLPTRLLKWSIAGVVAANWIIGENLSFTNIETHFLLGYIAGGLLVARLLWGLVGSKTARFSTMLRDILGLGRYLGTLFQRKPSHWRGHTPTGALWLLAFLVVLAGQVITGLFSFSDSYFSSGPLADLVDESVRLQFVSLHHLFGKLMLALVALHLAAVAFYAVWKRENLVGPMITGRRSATDDDTDV